MSGPVMADAWVRVVPSDAVSTGRQADRLVAGAGVFSLLYPPFPLACRSNLKHFESFQMSDTALLTRSVSPVVCMISICMICKKIRSILAHICIAFFSSYALDFLCENTSANATSHTQDPAQKSLCSQRTPSLDRVFIQNSRLTGLCVQPCSWAATTTERSGRSLQRTRLPALRCSAATLMRVISL